MAEGMNVREKEHQREEQTRDIDRGEWTSVTVRGIDDAGLAEYVYSLGIGHTHTLDNTNTFCAIPSRRASDATH